MLEASEKATGHSGVSVGVDPNNSSSGGIDDARDVKPRSLFAFKEPSSTPQLDLTSAAPAISLFSTKLINPPSPNIAELEEKKSTQPPIAKSAQPPIAKSAQPPIAKSAQPPIAKSAPSLFGSTAPSSAPAPTAAAVSTTNAVVPVSKCETLFDKVHAPVQFSFKDAFDSSGSDAITASSDKEEDDQKDESKSHSNLSGVSTAVDVLIPPSTSGILHLKAKDMESGVRERKDSEIHGVTSVHTTNKHALVDKICGASVNGDLARVVRLLDEGKSSGELFKHADTLTAESSAFKAQTVFNGSDGRSPLYCASGRGSLPIVQALLERYPAMVNVTNKYGTTCLSWASFNGHVDVVRCLLSLRWQERY